MTVKIVTYRALEAGPTLAVLGAIHGNERCGAEAIARLVKEIDNGAVTLKRGTMVRKIRLTGDPEEIEANVDKVKGLVLKTEFIKKA